MGFGKMRSPREALRLRNWLLLWASAAGFTSSSMTKGGATDYGGVIEGHVPAFELSLGACERRDMMAARRLKL